MRTIASKKLRCALALAILVSGTTSPSLHAQKMDPELKALDAQLPGVLVNDPRSLDWPGYGPNCKREIKVDPTIPGGGAAASYSVQKAGANPWDCGAAIPIASKLDQGEVVTVGLWVRLATGGGADGKGVLIVRFQENAAPYGGFGDARRAIGNQWQWIEVSAIADRHIARGKAAVALQLAGAAQVIEIGQAIVVTGTPWIAE